MTKGIANPHFEAGGLQIRRNKRKKRAEKSSFFD